MTCHPVPLNDEAVQALDPAMKRGGNDWFEAQQWIQEGSARVWRINGTGYALTVANMDNEIEVVAAGGIGARKCIKPWLEAMWADPRHKGMTIKIEGARRGWKRLLPDWKCEEMGDGDVMLTTRID